MGGRDCPIYCKHDRCIDPGDFLDESEGCNECRIPPFRPGDGAE